MVSLRRLWMFCQTVQCAMLAVMEAVRLVVSRLLFPCGSAVFFRLFCCSAVFACIVIAIERFF